MNLGGGGSKTIKDDELWSEMNWISRGEEMVSPSLCTATRFFMMVANKTLKHKMFVVFLLLLELHWDVR